MFDNRGYAWPARHFRKPGPARWFVASLMAALSIAGCRSKLDSVPAPYDGMVKLLHAGITNEAVEARLGKPYLSAYNVGNHVSAIYRVNGTILPFIVRFQKVESLVIQDPSAKVDSWCAYVRVNGLGDPSALVFAPANMSASETANWISGRTEGFSFPGQAAITEADPNRPQGDGGETKLLLVRSTRRIPDTSGESSEQLVQMDSLNLRLACHPLS